MAPAAQRVREQGLLWYLPPRSESLDGVGPGPLLDVASGCYRNVHRACRPEDRNSLELQQRIVTAIVHQECACQIGLSHRREWIVLQVPACFHEGFGILAG